MLQYSRPIRMDYMASAGGTAFSPVCYFVGERHAQYSAGGSLTRYVDGIADGSPFSYTVSAPASVTPTGDKFDEAAVRREAYGFYFLDAWKVNAKLNVNIGLRYELNSRIKEAKHRTSIAVPVDASGNETSFLAPGATQIFLYNPQPVYPLDKNGWGPRIAADYALTKHTMLHAGAAITTLLPNLWLENFVTGGFPLVFQPIITALPGVPVAFSNTVVPTPLPDPFTIQGTPLFPNGDSSKVPANTQIDLQKYQSDLAAITPGHEVQLFTPGVISRCSATDTSERGR